MPISEVEVPVPRRRDDPEDEDHRRERRFDWREMAPRWALVTALAATLAWGGYLTGRLKSVDDDRIALMQKYQNDARWDLISQHTSEISDIRREQLRQNVRLEKLDAMAEDVRVLRRIAEATRRSIAEQGR